MRHLARQFLRLFLVAAALGASSLNGYAAVLAAFDTHAHGHHAAHDHPASHAHQDGGVEDGHAALDQDGQDHDPASSDQPCAHVHAHCCSTSAVPAGDCTLKFTPRARAGVPVADSHVPHGQLATRLFRPPRAIA